jgi:methanol dehydrogenase (cytochrome c) subunit 1
MMPAFSSKDYGEFFPALLSAAIGSALWALAMPAQANKDLDRLSKGDTNWVMQTKDYSATH